MWVPGEGVVIVTDVAGEDVKELMVFKSDSGEGQDGGETDLGWRHCFFSYSTWFFREIVTKQQPGVLYGGEIARWCEARWKDAYFLSECGRFCISLYPYSTSICWILGFVSPNSFLLASFIPVPVDGAFITCVASRCWSTITKRRPVCNCLFAIKMRWSLRVYRTFVRRVLMKDLPVPTTMIVC